MRNVAIIALSGVIVLATSTHSPAQTEPAQPAVQPPPSVWGWNAVTPTDQPPSPDDDYEYLGRLSRNPYRPDSISNPNGAFGNRYAPKSLRNRYGRYGSPYSTFSSTNPYGTAPPRLYGGDGTYLGELSRNRYAPDSISNPYGRYGSPYSPDSIKNPYGIYGSPYSPLSPTNPFASDPPVVLGWEP